VLIRNPGKSLELPLSYRPLNMVNMIAKIFKRIVKRRLKIYLTENSEGLSENQFRF